MVRSKNANPWNSPALWMVAVLLCVALLGFYTTREPGSEKTDEISGTNPRTAPKTYPRDLPFPETKSTVPKRNTPVEVDAPPGDALRNQRSITFSDRYSMNRFLSEMGGNLRLLGRVDKLNTLRIGFRNESDLSALLDGTEGTSFIFPVSIPETETVEAQEDAVPFSNGLLDWLGIDSDTDISDWGKGVKVAILDTGIADHIAFPEEITRIDLVPLPDDLTEQNGHGTAVASLIFSNNPRAPGIAPGATPLSIRVADDSGASDSFLIAQGIVAAVDEGAQLINISLGGAGKSNLTEQALAYAREAGSIVIAASGNDGRDVVNDPAASSYAIAVGAVDAKNEHLAFSTGGTALDVSAAGFKINAAYPGDRAVQASGTSFSAPAITGTLAATMSNRGSLSQNAASAVETMNRNLNDIGTQGIDTTTGAGVPDMWRILNTGRTGIYDAAVTSITTAEDSVRVLVQNQGTDTIINAGVSVSVNGSTTTTANITTLAPGESRTVSVQVSDLENANVQGRIRLSSGQADQRPSNDSFSKTFPTSSP